MIMENNIRRGRPPKGLFQKRTIDIVPQDPDAGVNFEEASHVETNPMRPPLRVEDDARARAKQRADQLRGHLGDVVDGTDEFYISPDVIPDGWAYEWKRNTIYGAEDPAYQVALARSGWTAVPTSRHPDMMPHDANSGIITRKGCILMEIPKEIQDERREADQRKARNQVRQKEAQLSGAPEGTMERTRPEIRKSYSPVQIGDK
jgi:hypothetical protein